MRASPFSSVQSISPFFKLYNLSSVSFRWCTLVWDSEVSLNMGRVETQCQTGQNNDIYNIQTLTSDYYWHKQQDMIVHKKSCYTTKTHPSAALRLSWSRREWHSKQKQLLHSKSDIDEDDQMTRNMHNKRKNYPSRTNSKDNKVIRRDDPTPS